MKSVNPSARRIFSLPALLLLLAPSVGGCLEISPHDPNLCSYSSQGCDLDWDGAYDRGQTPDCDDSESRMNPDAEEVCDGLDNDCNGETDEAPDDDLDGESNCTDCADQDAAISAGVEEVCNGKDDDCNGRTDDVTSTWFLDEDGDTFGSYPTAQLEGCVNAGWSLKSGDCNDKDIETYPGASEICDGNDNDCVNKVGPEEQDLDHDSFWPCNGDCDDNNVAVFPGAPEFCDGLDNDCNGALPEDESDRDGDGYLTCINDCNDQNELIYANAEELCDGLDNDCDGLVDVDVDEYNYALSAGAYHSLATCTGGGARGWGGDTYGQAGSASLENLYVPTELIGLTEIVALSGGYSHSLALTDNRSDVRGGGVWAWGNNKDGQLGTYCDAICPEPTPIDYSPMSKDDLAKGIAAGGRHSLLRNGYGMVLAWGANEAGQLGIGSSASSNTPSRVTFPVSPSDDPAYIVDIAAGDTHSLALDSKGRLWSWGSNSNGQLGAGTMSLPNRATPEQVLFPNMPSGEKPARVFAGAQFSAILTEARHVWTWGYNRRGELGIGTSSQENVLNPVQVVTSEVGPDGKRMPLEGVIALSTGGHHCLAIRSDHTVWSWGQNTYGQLGDGWQEDRPFAVPISVPETMGPVQEVAAGGYHSLARGKDGVLWAWGENNYGQLGSGAGDPRVEPTLVGAE